MAPFNFFLLHGWMLWAAWTLFATTMIASNRWLGVRLDMICVFFGVGTAILSIFLKDQVEKELLTFSLTIITDVIALFSISVRFYSEIQNMMTCSQRMYQYTQLETEDELVKKNDKDNKDWPNVGEINIEGVSMRYREGMEPSLRDLSCKIQPGMKVGIVGRTGAGKSTILQSLFRLSDIHEGTIHIDGVDHKSIGLHLLRKNIAYIPQAPFLIQGSIRENLDPFSEFSDDEINKVLKDVNLSEHIAKNSSDGIWTKLTESNNFFSMG